jgi:hypothetical protein
MASEFGDRRGRAERVRRRAQLRPLDRWYSRSWKESPAGWTGRIEEPDGAAVPTGLDRVLPELEGLSAGERRWVVAQVLARITERG